MPSIKITQLPILTQLSANNANTVFVAVDKTTNTTSQFSTTTLAAALFANNVLNVGTQDPSNFPGLIAQFVANTSPYGQVNYENANSHGSMDIVLTADIGDDSNNFIDLGIHNSLYSDPNYDAIGAADGYLAVQGSSASNYVGNLVIGTTTSQANLLFSVGGLTTSDVSAKITSLGLDLMSGRAIYFADDSVQSTAASPAAVTLSAQANTIITQGVDATQNTRLNSIETVNADQNTAISIIQGVNLTQNTNITTSNNHAWAAFDKANNALANTTGTFGGTLNISNNLTVNGTVVLANTNFAATEAAFRITAAGSSRTPTQAGTLMQLTSKPDVPARVLIDSFGTSNTAYPIIAGRNARGTVVSPTPTQNNDILLRIAGNSYGDTGYAPFGDARIDFVASENHSDTNRGSRIRFWNTPNGSNVVNEIASFNADSVYFTGTVAPEKGFIYTPTIYQGAQTAITIDFSTTSLIKADLTADLTFTLTNYQYGKVVEVWLVNTGGTQRTITHGCTATNSTTNSTTFNMAATSSAYLRYFSINGDNANTFVAVQFS
jgi:hypothetical protein